MNETPNPAQDASADPGVLLHQRLMAGGVTAPAEIAEAYLPGLIAHMEERNRGVNDLHLPATAAIDALQNYLQRPKQYNPEMATLETYLRMAAQGDLLNALKKQSRELKYQGGERVVELDAPSVEDQVEANVGLGVEEQVETRTSQVWSQIEALVPDPTDREIVRLMMARVRKTEEYARVLGITALAHQEQEQQVKRHKDRLKKRLMRHLRSEETDGEK